MHDPVVLRSLMSRLDALVSGSFALQFFERVVWKDSGLDIYVEYGREDETTTMLEQHLVEAEDYTLKPPVESPPINYPRIPAKHIYKVLFSILRRCFLIIDSCLGQHLSTPEQRRTRKRPKNSSYLYS